MVAILQTIPVARSLESQPPQTLVEWDTDIREHKPPALTYTLAMLLVIQTWSLGICTEPRVQEPMEKLE